MKMCELRVKGVVACLAVYFLLCVDYSQARRWREGPQVDPGVFVITHIRSVIHCLHPRYINAQTFRKMNRQTR